MEKAGIKISDEVRESLDLWLKFCSTCPNPAVGGEILNAPGIVINCCRTLWPVGNIAVLTAPVSSIDDLAQRAQKADKCFADRGCVGVFFVAENLVESVRSGMTEAFAKLGYSPAATIMGMAADELAAPVRSLPPLRYSLCSDAESHRVVGELNAMAEGVPLEWGQDLIARTDWWSHGATGIVGYFDECPAACAITVPLDGRLYVACVATAHEFRRRGCAEAVMRRSLEIASGATGIRRTILHASPMGRPLYLQMGYHETLPFTLYARA